LIADPTTPQVPVVRLLDAGLAAQMAEYAVYAVLHFHRRMRDYEQQQRQRIWNQLAPMPASSWTAGVMGAGVIGGLILRHLVTLGYRVCGWSRSGTAVEGVESFAGDAEMSSFLSSCRVVINVLPLTPATTGILCAQTFNTMPHGSYVVNIGRGGHLVEDDLLVALETGQIAGAMLDVFNEEPLPQSSSLWLHPNVIVTPHIAGVTIASEAEEQVIENVKRMERGETPVGVVDRSKGY
jgi:glyoxylate/hydroxypyruvate reductase A